MGYYSNKICFGIQWSERGYGASLGHVRRECSKRLETDSRLGVSWAIVHLYPHTSPLPLSLNLLTSHSLPFCKQHLYGSHAFASRKVAYYFRYSIRTSCSSFIIIFTGGKLVLQTRAQEGFDDSFCVPKLKTLINAICRRGVFQQAMQGMYLFKFVQLRVVLITYVRPTSDSDPEETKGDSSRAMAPPPLPLAKKVRYWFGLSFLRTIAYLFRFPRFSCWASMNDVKSQLSP
jgi:hypothetical protein